MDDLPPDELRGAATAANLRRAFGPLDAGPHPQAFSALLRRLSEVDLRLPSCQSGVVRPGA